MIESEPCRDKCAPKGIRRTWWCGFPTKSTPKDHREHDYYYRGKWFHCHG